MDSAYQTQINALQTRLNNQNLVAGQDESTIRQNYGFDSEYASNPYTKANLLQRAAETQFNRTTNTAAASGHLYSGSTSNQRGYDEFKSGLERDQAMKEYASALQGVDRSRLGAQTDYTLGAADAQVGYLDRQLTAQQREQDLAYQRERDRISDEQFRISNAPLPPEAPAPAEAPAAPGSSGPTAEAIQKAQNILKNQQGKSPAAIAWAKQILGR